MPSPSLSLPQKKTFFHVFTAPSSRDTRSPKATILSVIANGLSRRQIRLSVSSSKNEGKRAKDLRGGVNSADKPWLIISGRGPSSLRTIINFPDRWSTIETFLFPAWTISPPIIPSPPPLCGSWTIRGNFLIPLKNTLERNSAIVRWKIKLSLSTFYWKFYCKWIYKIYGNGKSDRSDLVWKFFFANTCKECLNFFS